MFFWGESKRHSNLRIISDVVTLSVTMIFISKHNRNASFPPLDVINTNVFYFCLLTSVVITCEGKQNIYVN